MRNLDRSKVERARTLRSRLTGSERAVWDRLRNKRIGYNFRRQHPVAGFVLDFYCDQARLCVEVDGTQHQENGRERDILRDSKLEELGIKDGPLLELRRGDELVGLLGRYPLRMPSSIRKPS